MQGKKPQNWAFHLVSFSFYLHFPQSLFWPPLARLSGPSLRTSAASLPSLLTSQPRTELGCCHLPWPLFNLNVGCRNCPAGWGRPPQTSQFTATTQPLAAVTNVCCMSQTSSEGYFQWPNPPPHPSGTNKVSNLSCLVQSVSKTCILQANSSLPVYKWADSKELSSRPNDAHLTYIPDA